MAATATAGVYEGIHNEQEFYSNHYLAEFLGKDIQETVKRWTAEGAASGQPPPHAALGKLAAEFARSRARFAEPAGRNHATTRDSREAQPSFAAGHAIGKRLALQNAWHRQLLDVLGYEWSQRDHRLDDGVDIPILASATASTGGAASRGNPDLLVIGALDPSTDDPSPLDLRPLRQQFRSEAPPPDDLLREDWERIVTRRVFAQDRPPRWVLLLSFGQALLIERGKWSHGRLLRFDLAEILGRGDAAAVKAAAVLLHRESLVPASGSGPSLLDELDGNSHRHAFGVSQDLKYAMRESIELIGNEAIRYLREVRHERVYNLDGDLADALGRECLRYMYRLLFLFYIEARPELGYAPLNSDAYRKGYGLERLRDLEMVELATPESRDGFYLHESVRMLFRLLSEGFDGDRWGGTRDLFGNVEPLQIGFSIRALDSALFREGSTPLLDKVKLRNHILQRVIRLLSLNRPVKSGKSSRIRRRGRIRTRTWASTSWDRSTNR